MTKLKREKYINIINEYHDILRELRDKYYQWDSISEYDSVYQDILDYEDSNYYYWREKDFTEFIDYLNKLTREVN